MSASASVYAYAYYESSMTLRDSCSVTKVPRYLPTNCMYHLGLVPPIPTRFSLLGIPDGILRIITPLHRSFLVVVLMSAYDNPGDVDIVSLLSKLATPADQELRLRC